MNVTRVRWAPFRIAFREPYVTSRGSVLHREGLILELTADDGRVGLGEAAPDPSLGKTGAELVASLETIAQHLVGAALEELAVRAAPDDGVIDPIESAIACAVDVATLDALAALKGGSVASFLNPASALSVPVNALITSSDPVLAQSRAAVAARAGFGTIKLKVGVLSSLDAERERVAAVREAIGPAVKLRLDPNGAWTEAQAIAAIRAFQGYDIEYVEQPVAPGDLESLARVQAAVDTPIAADEDAADLAATERIVAAGAARVLVLKPQRLGGLRPCLEIVHAAEDAGLSCVITTSIESGIGVAAALHLAASLPGHGLAHGLATSDFLASDLITPHLEVSNGALHLPDAPGLGVGLHASAANYLGPWQEVSS